LFFRYVSTKRGVISIAPSICFSVARLRSLSTSSISTAKPAKEVDFLLADIGEGIAECELLKWMVKSGDRISQFDPVCEVQSDKANVEITSRYDGIIKTLHSKPGDMIKVGRPLITILLDQEGTSEQTDLSPPPYLSPLIAPSTPVPSLPLSDLPNEKALASPAVRAMAREFKLDLTLIRGTGKEGRITKEDVINYMEGKSKSIPTATPTAPSTPESSLSSLPSPKPTTPPSKTPTLPQSSPVSKPLLIPEEDKIVPISGLQRIMVQTMTASNAVPQFGYSDEFYVDELIRVRNQVKKMAEKEGVRLSYLAFIVKAASLALLHYPQLNAWIKDQNCTEIIYKASHNIGLAMDTPRGLLVPNIKNVQNKSILDIGREINRLSELGQQGKLGKDDLVGGTFTISNIGSIGGTYTKPIILLPEVMIGGLGKFQTLPRFDSKNNIYPATVMAVSWSADHRVLDGATVARFSNLAKQYVENPSSIIINTK